MNSCQLQVQHYMCLTGIDILRVVPKCGFSRARCYSCRGSEYSLANEGKGTARANSHDKSYFPSLGPPSELLNFQSCRWEGANFSLQHEAKAQRQFSSWQRFHFLCLLSDRQRNPIKPWIIPQGLITCSLQGSSLRRVRSRHARQLWVGSRDTCTNLQQVSAELWEANTMELNFMLISQGESILLAVFLESNSFITFVKLCNRSLTHLIPFDMGCNMHSLWN